MTTPDQLADELAGHLGPVLAPSRFRYRKSSRAFRRVTGHGFDSIDPLITRTDPGSYTLSFAFGVRHTAVEEVRSGLGLPTDRDSPTAVTNSFNVHPSRVLSYPGPTFWAIRPPVPWAEMLREIGAFLTDVVLPWLDRFADRRALRAAVAADDGRVAALRPWETVAALDLLDDRPDELAAYLTTLRGHARRWVPARAAELSRFVRSIAGRLPPEFADVW